MSPARRFVISRLDQMSAIRSPARQEILDVLARMGAASLAEVAAVLGRPADALYYHVRVLERVGLIVPAGTRAGARRSERLIRAAAGEFALRYASPTPSQARAVAGIVASMLRLGARDFRRALANAGNRVEGAARDLWALRTTGWLTEEQVAGVNGGMQALSRRFSGPPRRGRLYGITILLTPLDHRSRRARTTPAPAGAPPAARATRKRRRQP